MMNDIAEGLEAMYTAACIWAAVTFALALFTVLAVLFAWVR